MSPTDPTGPTTRRFDCAQVLDRLEALVDGDLPAAEQAAMRAHFDGPRPCPTCARELARARRLRDELRALPLEVCPQEVVDSAFARARTEELAWPEEPGDRSRAGQARSRLRPAATTLAHPANDDGPGTGTGWWSVWQVAGAAAAAVLLVIGLLALSRLLPEDRLLIDDGDPAIASSEDPPGDGQPGPFDAGAEPGDAAGPDALDPGDQLSRAEIERATAEARLALAYVASVGRRSALVLRDEVVGDNIIAPSARALQRAMEPLRRNGDAASAHAGTGDRR